MHCQIPSREDGRTFAFGRGVLFMKLIPVGKTNFAQVDDEDFKYLSSFRWQLYKKKHTSYARRRKENADGSVTHVSMHREIMKTPRELVGDHRDGKGLNNQKYNLRNCTVAQNAKNRAPNKNSKSKYKGVKLDLRNLIWRAVINVNKKTINLGGHKTEIEAAKAYDVASIKYHGEFGKTNF